VTEGDLLSSLGTTQFFVTPSGTNEITVDCMLLGAATGATGPGTLFTIEFTGAGLGTSPLDVTVFKVRDKDNAPLSGFYEDDGELIVDLQNPSVTNVLIENLTLAHTDDFIKDGDDARVTATVTDDDPLFGIGNITADLSDLGGGSADPPDGYVGNVATWTTTITSVSCSPADGAVNVTVTATDAIGNTASGSDGITADNTAPGKITGFDAAPHHQRVALSWNDPSGLDDNYYGVVVRHDGGGDYAQYTTLGSYPANHTAGDGEAYNSTGVVTGGDHTIATRDIYYYSAFVYDWALNYGTVDAGGQDRATNYWLGDFNPSTTGDGYVNSADLVSFSGTYGTVDGGPGFDPEADFGPSDDWSRMGIPEPDDVIDFEDLMIFGMNYGNVSPT
jgi:hypothetical protein